MNEAYAVRVHDSDGSFFFCREEKDARVKIENLIGPYYQKTATVLTLEEARFVSAEIKKMDGAQKVEILAFEKPAIQSAFEVGDVVILKGGGQIMTIGETSPSRTQCVFFNAHGNVTREEFVTKTLILWRDFKEYDEETEEIQD